MHFECDVIFEFEIGVFKNACILQKLNPLSEIQFYHEALTETGDSLIFILSVFVKHQYGNPIQML